MNGGAQGLRAYIWVSRPCSGGNGEVVSPPLSIWETNACKVSQVSQCLKHPVKHTGDTCPCAVQLLVNQTFNQFSRAECIRPGHSRCSDSTVFECLTAAVRQVRTGRFFSPSSEFKDLFFNELQIFFDVGTNLARTLL